MAFPILPLNPGWNSRFTLISTVLPPFRGLAPTSHVLPGSKTLESMTFASTTPGADQS